MPHRRHLYFQTRGNASGAPYVDLQLFPAELAAIGHVTAQWAFLEFLILWETRNLIRHLGIPEPDDTLAVSFRKRRELWEKLVRQALERFPEELSRSLSALDRVKSLAPLRHRLTHDVIEYTHEDRSRLKVFPRADLGRFGWPVDAAKIEELAHNIARLNHDMLSIHRDPEIARDASPRIPRKLSRHGPLRESGDPAPRLASSRSRKRQR